MARWLVPTMKTCTKCNVEFPNTLEYFNKHTTTKDKLETRCKTCKNKANAKWQKENSERVNAKAKAWRDRNPEKRNAIKKAWNKANPERIRAMRSKHRALKSGVLHEDWTEIEVVNLYGRDCYLCDTPIDFDAPRKGIGSDYSLWVDHIVPISALGENTVRNVRPCHSKCNRAKNNKSLSDYLFSVNSQDIVTIK